MKIVFMGTPEAAARSLDALAKAGHEIVAAWTQPDRPSGRGKKMKAPPVKKLAEELGIPVFQPLRIKTREARETFSGHQADVAVVVAYGRILPKSYLEAFPLGSINVHFSLLPKYRGAAPVNWAIVNGEHETGVTTMLMDEGLDTGDILLQKATRIGESETAIELMSRLSDLGAELLVRTLDELNEISPRKQDEQAATLAPMMTKEDGLIDWSMTAIEIANRIRGFQPFPKSYSFTRVGRTTFWSAKPCDGSGKPAAEGTVIVAEGDDLKIACGGGTVLEVHELQQEGKRRMEVRDFLNGSGLQEGERFSDG